MVVRAKVAGIDSPEALAHALTSAFFRLPAAEEQKRM